MGPAPISLRPQGPAFGPLIARTPTPRTPPILPNGDFSMPASPPTMGSGCAISAGRATASSAATIVTWPGVLIVGQGYVISLDCICTSGSKIRVNNSSTNGANIRDIQTLTVDGNGHPITFLPFIATNTDLSIEADSAFFSGSIDNVFATLMPVTEILPNGDFRFPVAPPPTLEAGTTSITGGKAVITTGASVLTWTGVLTVGQTYSISLIYNCTSGSKLRVNNSATSGAAVKDVQTLTVDGTDRSLTFANFVATGADVQIEADTAFFNGTLDNIVATLILAGGTTYNDNLSESLTGADSLNPAGSTFGVPISESLTGADSLASAATFPNALSEGLTGADSLTGGLLLAGALSETLTAADGLTSAMIFAPSLSESLASAFSISSSAIFASSLSEPLTGADSYASAAIFASSLSEGLTGAATLATSAIFPNALSESAVLVAIVDQGAATYNESLTESLAAAASQSTSMITAPALSETLTASSSLAASMVMPAAISEPLSANDNVAAIASYAAGLLESIGLAADVLLGHSHPVVAAPPSRSIVGDRGIRLAIGKAGGRLAVGNLQPRNAEG